MLKSFFDRVSDIVTNDRSNDYGDPVLNHMRIADLWNVWLNNRTWGPEITPYDASMMMNLVKFARCQHKPMTSSHEDIAGYAAVSDFICEKLKEAINERSEGQTPQDSQEPNIQSHVQYRPSEESEGESEKTEGVGSNPDQRSG